MKATLLSKGVIAKPTRLLYSSRPSKVRNSFVPVDRKWAGDANIVRSCRLFSRHRIGLSLLVTRRRKPGSDACSGQFSPDCNLGSSDVEERLAVEEHDALSRAGKDVIP